MKKVRGFFLGLIMSIAAQGVAADALTEALQKGLFEEEANQNLDAAIKAYQDVLSRADEQRRVAATALFRLAECYRKQGKTNEATAEYRRLVRDYSEQATLVNLSRQNLVGLGVTTVASATATGQAPDALTTDEEQQEIQRIRALIKNSPDLINTPNRKYGGVTGSLLHEAAFKGHLLVAEYLLANGADLHAQDTLQATPLYQAAGNGHKRMVELLLAKGAHPSPSATPQPLHAAVDRGFKAVVEVLLGHKASVNVKQPKEARPGYAPSPHEGMTALHIAIKDKNLQLAELLLANGADIDIPYKKQRAPNPLHRLSEFDGTPLHFAVQSQNIEAVRMLLAKKANLDARSGTGLTPLHYVPNPQFDSDNATRLAEMLLAGGAKVDALGTDDGNLPQWSPLHIAVFHKLPRIAQLLLEKGADPNLPLPAQSGNEGTALNMAVSGGAREIVELLLKHKADVNARDHNRDTPLVRAIRERNHQMAELLLAKDADPNALDAYGFPPLHVALGAQPPAPSAQPGPGFNPIPRPVGQAVIQNPSLLLGYGGVPQTVAASGAPAQPSQAQSFVELLLKHKADPNLRDNKSETPLHRAADQRNEAAAKLLLKYKADPNARTDFGMTPLHQAVTTREEALLDLLLAHNADATAALKDGDTALHFAAGLGLTNIAAKLVQKGADVNACGGNGDTPLHRLIRTPNVHHPKTPVSAFLLKLGANILKSCDGHLTPLELAMISDPKYHPSPLVEHFRKHHPRKLGVVTFDGPVVRPSWFWEGDDPPTLSEAIAAVGLKETADPTRITIMRNNPDTGLRGDRYNLVAIREKERSDVPLKHGDNITVAVRAD